MIGVNFVLNLLLILLANFKFFFKMPNLLIALT